MSQPLAMSPFVARNRDPILEVLRGVLPAAARPDLAAPGLVLEIASGTGEHGAYFASAFPHLLWQPSDRDEAALRHIAGHRAAAALPNLLPPLVLDAASTSWPVARADAIVAINMIHIAPWAATEGLMAGAARTLVPGGVLCLYGPFREGGRDTAPSNAAFDADLRRRDPAWGVRDLEAVVALAGAAGLHFAQRVAMPANNLMVIFRT